MARKNTAIRMSDAERRVAEALAAREHRTMGEMVREAIIAKAKRAGLWPPANVVEQNPKEEVLEHA